MEFLYKWKFNHCIEVKYGGKGNFFFCHRAFKSGQLQRHQKASICGKGTITAKFNIRQGIWRSGFLYKKNGPNIIPTTCLMKIRWKLCKHMEFFYKWKFNHCIEVKYGGKGKFSFCHRAFKSRPLQRNQKSSICGKGIRTAKLKIRRGILRSGLL